MNDNLIPVDDGNGETGPHISWQLDYEQLHKDELAKTAPEGHSDLMTYDSSFGEKAGMYSVFCPWAYKRVDLVHDYHDWLECPGCLRLIDIDSPLILRHYHS